MSSPVVTTAEAVVKKSSRQQEAEAVKALALSRAGKSIRDKVKEDSQTTLDAARRYLEEGSSSDPDANTNFGVHREKAAEFVKAGDLDAAIKMCERARDARDGIVLVKMPSEPGKVPAIIRDARNQTADPDLTRGVEAYEMQYLNLVGAAMAVIDAEVDEDKRGAAKKELLEAAKNFMGNFQKAAQEAGIIDADGNLPKGVDARIGNERQIAKMLDGMVEGGITKILSKAGIESPSDAISVYKDFQGLGNQPHNVVTLAKVTEDVPLLSRLQVGLSKIPGLGIKPPEPPKSRVVMEAEVAQKGLTEAQKEEYKKIFGPVENRPKWFTALPERQQNLVRQHAPAIIAGEVVMATQLWQLVGMKNPFTKFTGVVDETGKELEIVHISKHSGTLASISESTDIVERERITKLNFEQAAAGIEEDATLSVLDFNTAGALAKSHDGTITKQMDHVSQQMNKEKEGATSRATTPFNLGRLFGSSSQSSGAQDILQKISNELTVGIGSRSLDEKQQAALVSLKKHLELSNIKGFGIGAKERIKESGSMDPEKAISLLFGDREGSEKTIELLKAALELKEAVIKMSSASRFWSKGNASQDVSGAMAKLSHLSMKKDKDGKDIESNGLVGLSGLKPIESIQMCASGKDRTAWAMFLQSAKAVCNHIKKSGANISLEKISAAMVKAGHSAQQAGGSFSLGSAIGCFGTRFDNAWGMGKAGIALVRGAILPIVTKAFNAPVQLVGAAVGVVIAVGAKALGSETPFKDIVKQAIKRTTVNSEFLSIARSGLEKVAVGLVEFSSHGTRDHLHLKPHKGDFITNDAYKQAVEEYKKEKNANEVRKGSLKVTDAEGNVQYIKKPSRAERSSDSEDDKKKCADYDEKKAQLDKGRVPDGVKVEVLKTACAMDGTEKPSSTSSWKSYIPFTKTWNEEHTDESKDRYEAQVAKYKSAIHGNGVTDGGQFKGKPASAEVQVAQREAFKLAAAVHLESAKEQSTSASIEVVRDAPVVGTAVVTGADLSTKAGVAATPVAESTIALDVLREAAEKNTAVLAAASDALLGAEVAISGAGAVQSKPVAVFAADTPASSKLPNEPSVAMTASVEASDDNRAATPGGDAPLAAQSPSVADVVRVDDNATPVVTPSADSSTADKDAARAAAMEVVQNSKETIAALARGMENDSAEVVTAGTVANTRHIFSGKEAEEGRA